MRSGLDHAEGAKPGGEKLVGRETFIDSAPKHEVADVKVTHRATLRSHLAASHLFLPIHNLSVEPFKTGTELIKRDSDLGNIKLDPIN
jgi:hypothetical protein